jgi:hypothetical protein
MIAYVCAIFGSLFFVNAIPHFVSGVMGRPFQSPFAKPPGKGLSSSTVNVLWGAFNFAVAYVLLCRVGAFDAHDLRQVGAVGIAGLAAALGLARGFGRFHGGNDPQ